MFCPSSVTLLLSVYECQCSSGLVSPALLSFRSSQNQLFSPRSSIHSFIRSPFVIFPSLPSDGEVLCPAVVAHSAENLPSQAQEMTAIKQKLQNPSTTATRIILDLHERRNSILSHREYQNFDFPSHVCCFFSAKPSNGPACLLSGEESSVNHLRISGIPTIHKGVWNFISNSNASFSFVSHLSLSSSDSVTA